MLYGLYLSANGMLINQHKQDVIANNLANVDTPAFKRSVPVFKERLLEAIEDLSSRRYLPDNLKKASGGAFISAVHTDFSPASIERTGRALDVAIGGDGFFVVDDGGNKRYTRDGRLSVKDGVLVREVDGKAILSSDGRKIYVGDVSLSDIRIDSEGNVWAAGFSVGRIGVVDFDDKSHLRHLGGGLYTADDAGRPKSIDANIISGALENSSVSPALELVEMIKASRSFSVNAQMLSLQDETLGRLINQISRI